ncbi:MAG: DUF2269 family protein [Gammaproteobacteria bacterium]|nr:DUF2269 family protein [Gammaproteobacteria bacterium]
MGYALLKFVHVGGAVLFLGTLLLSGVWMRRALAAREAPSLEFALDGVGATDLRVAAPGAALLLVGGGGLLVGGGGELATQAWLSGGILLFLVAALGWAVGLVPLQRQMRHALRGAGRELPEACLRHGRHWHWAHLVTTLAAFAGLFLMVVRPGN